MALVGGVVSGMFSRVLSVYLRNAMKPEQNAITWVNDWISRVHPSTRSK